MEKKVVKPGDYVVDASKGNKLYDQLSKENDLKEQIKKEAGESTFGQSKQQHSMANNDDTPFFLR